MRSGELLIFILVILIIVRIYSESAHQDYSIGTEQIFLDMDKYNKWTANDWWYNHIKIKRNITVCIFYGMYYQYSRDSECFGELAGMGFKCYPGNMPIVM